MGNASRIPVILPATTSSVGAPNWRLFVVDAAGQKLTAAMPAGFARSFAARVTADISKFRRFVDVTPKPEGKAPLVMRPEDTQLLETRPFDAEAIADSYAKWLGLDIGKGDDMTAYSHADGSTFKGYAPAPLEVGDISTSTNPYAVIVDFPATLRPADMDAAWPDLVERIAARLHKLQVCMQQDDDLRPEMVMKLTMGWQVHSIEVGDPAGHGTRLVLDPYTFGADPLRRNSALILGMVRGLHMSVATGPVAGD